MRKIPKQFSSCGTFPKRATAEHLGGTKVRFTSPCGYRYTKDYSKGPVAKRMPASGVAWLVRYWQNGGVDAECPKCRREAVAKLTPQERQLYRGRL